MNNVKLVYFNSETIDKNAVARDLTADARYRSHIEVKNGLLLVNFVGTSRDLYESLGTAIREQSFFVHDLDSDANAYWGFLNNSVWDWLRNNRR